MKKFLLTIIILSLLVPYTTHTANAQFSDLFKNNKNYEAIIFLEENNILTGYEDGTFRPNQEVNRAEFLKIILEGSNVPQDKDDIDIPFTDVKEDKWYTPYIKKAYNEGWIIGFNDNTFKPSKTITKAEALKILGEVQQWEITENAKQTQYKDVEENKWYTPYIAYAGEHGYLEEEGDTFEPDKAMTRAKISEIIYRTMILGKNGNETVDDDSEVEFKPVAYKEIPIDYYDSIILDEPMPNTFYKDETYIIKGETTVENYAEVSVFLDNNMYLDSDYLLFTGKVTDNRFEIPVHFEKSGNYSIGVIPGTSGNTKIENISVLDSLPASANTEESTESIQNMDIIYTADTTSIEFQAPQDTVKIFTFIQGTNKVRFITRQNINSLPLDYPSFEDFKEGEVTYFGELANLNSSRTEEKTFEATEHSFDQVEETKISAPIPDKLGLSQNISINGTAKTDILSDGYVIKPNGLVDVVFLETDGETSTYYDATTIPNGANFTFEYEPSGKGRYIIEVLDKNGIPVINHPLYMGDIIPLIPDYFDLNERTFFKGEFDADDLREDLLNEINKERAIYNYPEVKADTKLDDLAQSHSNDMAENSYFGHISSDGKTPNDRRLEAEIEHPVSENIAKDVSIIFAHLGLMRSGSHRESILNPDWYLVGLGIAEKEGYLYVTEEFSTGEITEENLKDYKNELTSSINKLREENNLSALTYKNDIESVCDYLNNKTISSDLTLTVDDLSEALNTYNIGGTSQYIGRTYNIWSAILSSILNDEENSILDESWVNIGVDVQLDETGVIHSSLILNK